MKIPLWLRAIRLTRALISLPIWIVGALLVGLANGIHWDHRGSFKVTADLFGRYS